MAKGKQQKRERVEKTESPMSKKTKKTVEETEQLVSSKEEKETVVKKESPGASKKGKKTESDSSECSFAGEPIPAEEARRRWPERYRKKESVKNLTSAGSKKGDEDEDAILKAKCHYSQAEVDGCIYNLYDDAYVKGEEGAPDYICRIVEFFKGLDNKLYFTARWFYRAEDTVIRSQANLHDPRRVFLSDIKDANTLDCIVSKVHILQVSPYVDLQEKEKTIPPCDFYYDMSYSVEYSTFANLPIENVRAGSDTSSTISSEAVVDGNAPDTKSGSEESCVGNALETSEMTLLDLYSGCGGMSTGLCHGSNLSGVNLVTRWAVDMNEYACKSMKWNHPETEVRNESAEDFLDLLKEWEKLCKRFSLVGSKKSQTQTSEAIFDDEIEGEGDESKVSPDEFEVGKFVGICFGETDNISKRGLKFKVRWKGYGPSDDTWEPVEGLSKCKERIYEFVKSGYKASILPLPGDVDVVCGGPPCQGISGFNRFRNREDPLADPKNHQLVVFMDIVNFLKPKYVLMENVVDILKFEGGLLGRYALCRLVSMNYQARLGMMAAGCYGVAQYRMRVFLWGARPTEKLPPYPLPTHNVINRGYNSCEFERNTVAYEEDQERQLEEALLLGDCISDLPPVENDESRDEMPYGKGPTTDFERLIRSGRDEYVDSSDSGGKTSQKEILYDHRPLCLNDDDYQRVCRIPKRKKANFRDLPGVLVGPDKKVQWDPNVPREYLSSGKPLVPDYAMTFVRGTSSKPFGRLWYDEIVPTVVTRAEPHNQVILHPEQDRVLTVRENARLQGFPDCYKLFGSIKERYIQVGNAVAVPVSRALGYALGLASKGLTSNEPLMKLPQKFPHGLRRVMSVAMEIAEDNV